MVNNKQANTSQKKSKERWSIKTTSCSECMQTVSTEDRVTSRLFMYGADLSLISMYSTAMDLTRGRVCKRQLSSDERYWRLCQGKIEELHKLFSKQWWSNEILRKLSLAQEHVLEHVCLLNLHVGFQCLAGTSNLISSQFDIDHSVTKLADHLTQQIVTKFVLTFH